MKTWKWITLLYIFLLFSCTSDIDEFFTSKENLSQIIAHQGNWQWEGWKRNSIEALKSALEMGFYGSECDVRMTKDSVFVIEHDDDYYGIKISATNYIDITTQLIDDVHLATLNEFFDIITNTPQSSTKLILDLKHVDVNRLLTEIERRGLESKVEFFCTRTYMETLRARGYAHATWIYDPTVTPQEAAKAGIKGVSYQENFIQSNGRIMEDIKTYRLKANVWTVNNKEKIKAYIQKGFIVTSDRPIQR